MQVFTDETGLHEHRRQRHADRYCVPCRRIFQTANALRQHQLTSAQHRSRTVICPMKGCGRAFPSLAALVLHLEAGTCASGMTRKMVDDIVRKLDKTHFVTKPNRRAIEAPPEGEVTGEWATERAWNGAAYECYWCHHTFATLRALNAHLRSPAHAEKIYRCPPRQSGCGAEFGTLSAFCQHMESGSCDVFRFKKAFERLLDRFPTSVGRLGAVQNEVSKLNWDLSIELRYRVRWLIGGSVGGAGHDEDRAVYC